jgi:hypothetical protein
VQLCNEAILVCEFLLVFDIDRLEIHVHILRMHCSTMQLGHHRTYNTNLSI